MIRIRILLLLLLISVQVFAMTGRVRGTVKDVSGKPIEKATITITSQGEINQKYTAHTNEKGEYIHIAVNPGLYRVTVAKEGYKTVEYDYVDVRVTLDERGSVADFKMQEIGKQAEMKAAETPEESASIKEAKTGIALLQAGKADEAIQSLEKAVALEPSNATIHYYLGAAYERKDDPEKARSHFQEAIKLKADFGEAYLALGNSYLSERKYDAPAIDALNKATELLPDDYDAFYNLGVCYSNSGKYTEAENAYRKAVALKPQEPVAHYQLGMALLGQSKNSEAKAEFNKYLELSPNAADKQEVLELIKSM